MVHDVAVPYPSVEPFLEYTSNELGIWPLWLCPLRAAQPPTFHPCTSDSDQTKLSAPMLNVGLWGAASKDIDLFIRQNQYLEARITELGGRKVLYAHTYYTKEQFWELYDRRWYETLRRKYTAATLPTVFDKVKVNAAQHILARSLPWYQRVGLNWPFAGFYGIWCAIKSKDYYIHRDLRWMQWKTKAKE